MTCGILNKTLHIVEKNPSKFKIDNKELTSRKLFIEQAREEVKVCVIHFVFDLVFKTENCSSYILIMNFHFPR